MSRVFSYQLINASAWGITTSCTEPNLSKPCSAIDDTQSCEFTATLQRVIEGVVRDFEYGLIFWNGQAPLSGKSKQKEASPYIYIGP